MSRVVVHHSYSPLVFVAPHGYKGDDFNTDLLVKIAAQKSNASYIINQGWQRDDIVDEDRDRADCNNYKHMANEVLQDEFLMPFKRLCLRAKKNFGGALVLFIHGISNNIRKTSGVKDVDVVLGYGLGKPDVLTCTTVCRENFLFNLHMDDLRCAIGKAGGKYSGNSQNNMNQFWRKIELDHFISSMQLEIVRELRDDKVITEITGETIGLAAQKAYYCTSFKMPSSLNFSYV